MKIEVAPQETTRAEAFSLWMTSPMPMVTLTKTFNVTKVLKASKRHGIKFNALLCWCIGKAASNIKEFYILPEKDKLFKYDSIAINIIVKNSKGGINSCDIAYTDDAEQFAKEYNRLTAQVATQCKSKFLEDCMIVGLRGAAAIFAPEASEMYAENQTTWVYEEKLSTKLCGKSRPIHFRGVCTVVSKLFNIVRPDVAVFGQKDAQQALIIRRMVRDLNFPIEIIVAPLVRDKNNLALSSRNKYLDENQQKDALVLSRSIFAAKEAILSVGIGEIPSICEVVKTEIAKFHGIVDYVECLDSETFEEPTEATKELLLAVAAKFGTTRLIDNILINLE